MRDWRPLRYPPFCAAAGPILIKSLAAQIRTFCAASLWGLDRWFAPGSGRSPVGGCVCRASRPWASA